VPIPRRFDRRPPERDTTRINERIRVPEVRLIGDDGNQVGVVSRDEALKYAQERDLDLVEVAADARPPVCRVLDYSKYKYEQEQKAKAARRHQKQVTVREMKMRPKIAKNDYETKKGHVLRFLKGQDRGREMTHPERGEQLLMRLAEDLAEYGVIEQRPSQDGRNMTMVLAPTRAKGEEDAAPADAAEEPQQQQHQRRPRRQQRIEAAEAADGQSAEQQPAEQEAAEPQAAETPEGEAPGAAA
jgi:translation initiation factor IF-3